MTTPASQPALFDFPDREIENETGGRSSCDAPSPEAAKASRFPLVPKLQLGNAPVCEAPLRQRTTGGSPSPSSRRAKQSFGDKRVTKLELGNEAELSLRKKSVVIPSEASALRSAVEGPLKLSRASATIEAPTCLAELRALLAEKFPAPTITRGELWPTGLPALDTQTGGLRRGVLTEISGSTGSAALFLEALLRATRHARTFAALIDPAHTFDPCGTDPALLRRLLWIRPDTALIAIKVADLLLRDGNLPLIALDLQTLPLRELRRIPANTWHRFQRLVEQTPAAFVILTPRPLVEGAKVRIVLQNRWSLATQRQRRHELLARLSLRIFPRGAQEDEPILADTAPHFQHATMPEPLRKIA